MDWNMPPHRPKGGKDFGELEQLVEQIRNRLGFRLPTGNWFGFVALIVLLLVLGVGSYYRVDPEETAVVQRFGRFVRTADPGPHFRIPFGIETVKKVRNRRVLVLESGYRTVKSGARSQFTEKGFEEQARMLSGDLNVIDLQWTVQYQIKDPIAYLFQVEDVEAAINDISESVVRKIVGNRYADDVLTVGRASIAEMAKVEMQQVLDSYNTGILIVAVQLQNATPPNPVKAAFNEVNEAGQEKERMINDAQKVSSQELPKAYGEAKQIISQAEGYALERVNRAQGEARRFLDILAEYGKAPDVSRQRMYVEALQALIGKMERLIVLDDKQRNVLPLLDLNRLPDGATLRDAGKSSGAETQSGHTAGTGDKTR
ncbi:MAG TPA: FtsH protease activity modulator HflK [Syntrophobacteraceae bacterium]|nr:FtsH protease activity modulator HflK [Syntrophobacteraceae bacterium]HBD06780.1 FtsH protease activity modulator HflK [Syntrophobacteraceae bacterium]HBZ55592.1 FtsH protease activity modulator HflK [Syntrophobacteraceae bacterium]